MNDVNVYWKLLNNPKWEIKRKEILKRDFNKCITCGTNVHLHVHHKQYHFSKKLQLFKKPWEYPDYLLATFCSKCHNNGHKSYKIPTKYF